MSAYVLLEDGTRFDGDAVGADAHAVGEVVFTTGMSGYQESMTDPSFAGQLITFTYPHIGNYGVRSASMESDRPWARAAIMREANDTPDAPGADGGWLAWLRANGIPAITGATAAATASPAAAPSAGSRAPTTSASCSSGRAGPSPRGPCPGRCSPCGPPPTSPPAP